LAASIRVVAHDKLIIFGMESVLDVAYVASRREVAWSRLIWVLQGRTNWASALGRQPVVGADEPASMWARCLMFVMARGSLFVIVPVGTSGSDWGDA